MKKLPKTIYVQGDEYGFLIADTDLSNDQFEERDIGIYELKEIKNRKLKIILE